MSNSKTINQEKLAELTSNGWSWHGTPNVPDTSDANMYLVTDNNGNRKWVKQLGYWTIEEQVLIAETDITNASNQIQYGILNQLIPIKSGDVVKVIFDGVTYETTVAGTSQTTMIIVFGVCQIGLTGVGNTSSFRNLTGKTGVLSVTVVTDKYYTIDPNLLPTATKSGAGYCSVILTPYASAKADGMYSVSANYAEASAAAAFAANFGHAKGMYSFATGRDAYANGIYSHVEGCGTIASGDTQHAEGKYNVEDTEGKYAHIIGNGTESDSRSNAYTLDWEGNGWFAGTVECAGIFLTSPNGTKYKITVADDGTLTATAVTV